MCMSFTFVLLASVAHGDHILETSSRVWVLLWLVCCEYTFLSFPMSLLYVDFGPRAHFSVDVYGMCGGTYL